jgi:hypothetical protein
MAFAQRNDALAALTVWRIACAMKTGYRVRRERGDGLRLPRLPV